MGDTRRDLAPRNAESVLREIAKTELDEEEQPVPNWAIVREGIEGDLRAQADDLLAQANDDYARFETLRRTAERTYGRADPTVTVLAGLLVAYLVLTFAGPLFLSEAAANPGLGLTLWFTIVPALGIAVRWPFWRRRRTRLMRSVPLAYRRWTVVLREQVLRPFITAKLNDAAPNPLGTVIGQSSPPRFIAASDPLRLVVTTTMVQLRDRARHIPSGSIGISGPHGVGKSMIVKSFGTKEAGSDDKDLRLVVPAPVDYEFREFLIHLFIELCQAVPDGSAIAAENKDRLEHLWYLNTYTTNRSASFSLKALLSVVWGSATQRAERPFTLPQLVGDFRDHAERVATWWRSGHPGGRLVIGIDEVDRIHDSERADAFLHDIKAVFGVPGSVYLVSLSEEAMAGFARRTPSIRDSFANAFDELVTVGPMGYRQSEEMLFKRVIGVPRPFAALCHVLAGGRPREVEHQARALVDIASADGGKPLAEMTGDLIRRELDSLRQESLGQLAETTGLGSLLAALDDPEWPGTTPADFIGAAKQVAGAIRDADSDPARRLCQELAVSLSFYATTLEVFAAGPDRLIACLEKQDYAVIDELAMARYNMRINTELAHQSLERYRLRHGIGTGNENAAS